MHLESLHGGKVPEIETETLVQLALFRYAAVHFGYGLRVRLGGTGSASVCSLQARTSDLAVCVGHYDYYYSTMRGVWLINQSIC